MPVNGSGYCLFGKLPRSWSCLHKNGSDLLSCLFPYIYLELQLTKQSTKKGIYSCSGYQNQANNQFQPADSYNYHPLLPPSSDSKIDLDPEAQSSLTIEEKTCSICMEEVDTTPGPSSEVLLGMNRRRSYAVAPCHHLFHTRCLAQWLAIKVCPHSSRKEERELTIRRYVHCVNGVYLLCSCKQSVSPPPPVMSDCCIDTIHMHTNSTRDQSPK